MGTQCRELPWMGAWRGKAVTEETGQADPCARCARMCRGWCLGVPKMETLGETR